MTTRYALRVDEERILLELCREIDLIERLEAALTAEDAELIVKGSTGQQVANPLMGAIRQHRALEARLAAQLGLPAEEEQAQRPDMSSAARRDSESARGAALASWGKRGG